MQAFFDRPTAMAYCHNTEKNKVIIKKGHITANFDLCGRNKIATHMAYTNEKISIL